MSETNRVFIHVRNGDVDEVLNAENYITIDHDLLQAGYCPYYGLEIGDSDEEDYCPDCKIDWLGDNEDLVHKRINDMEDELLQCD